MVTFNIFNNVNAGVPAQNNSFWDFLNQKKETEIDPNIPIMPPQVNFITLDRTVFIRGKSPLIPSSWAPVVESGFTIAPFIVPIETPIEGATPTVARALEISTWTEEQADRFIEKNNLGELRDQIISSHPDVDSLRQKLMTCTEAQPPSQVIFSPDAKHPIFQGDVLISFFYPTTNARVIHELSTGFYNILKTLINQQLPGVDWNPRFTGLSLQSKDTFEASHQLGEGPHLEYQYRKIANMSTTAKPLTGIRFFGIVFFEFDKAIYDEHATPPPCNRFAPDGTPVSTFADSSIRNEGSYYTNSQFILDCTAALKDLFLTVNPSETFTVQGE